MHFYIDILILSIILIMVIYHIIDTKSNNAKRVDCNQTQGHLKVGGGISFRRERWTIRYLARASTG